MNVMTSEDRRMSNMSDWAPSVVSSVDIQVLNTVESCNLWNIMFFCLPLFKIYSSFLALLLLILYAIRG